MGKRATETFQRVILPSYTADQLFCPEQGITLCNTRSNTDSTYGWEQSQCIRNIPGTLSFPSREAKLYTLENISTEGLLTAHHAAVQQIRLAAHLTDPTGLKPHNSFHLHIPFPTLSYHMLENLFSSPGSTPRDALLFLPHCKSIPCCTLAHENSPL